MSKKEIVCYFFDPSHPKPGVEVLPQHNTLNEMLLEFHECQEIIPNVLFRDIYEDYYYLLMPQFRAYKNELFATRLLDEQLDPAYHDNGMTYAEHMITVNSVLESLAKIWNRPL